MNVSKKIYASIWKSNLNVFSSVIKKIALATIAIGLSSIILSVFILEGFKKEIKKKYTIFLVITMSLVMLMELAFKVLL